VSIHIKRLEEQIGSALLYRSTRQITLTQDGKTLYQSSKAMVQSAENGLGQFARQASTQLTDLRVAIPDTLSSNPIFEKIALFTKNHTGIRLNIMSTDQQQNLIEERHDVAIRMGYFKNSDLKSKRIDEDQRVVVVSPNWLSVKSTPTMPDDLLSWDFISFSIVPDGLILQKGSTKSDNIWGNVVAKANSVASVHALCLAGLGIATLPYHLVKTDIQSGRLTHLLSDWKDTKALPIYLVWIPNADLNTATREFINFMSRS